MTKSQPDFGNELSVLNVVRFSWDMRGFLTRP
jgi:hypothetical protein